jgi:hypothetical protein
VVDGSRQKDIWINAFNYDNFGTVMTNFARFALAFPPLSSHKKTEEALTI